jgi:hypothetical protein
MNKYVYGLILACALLSLPSVNCAAAPEPDAAEEARGSKGAYIQACKDAGADKREARRLAKEAKEAAKKAKAEAEAKDSESEKGTSE